MGTIFQSIHTTCMNILNDELGVAITLKIPKQNNINSFTVYPLTAFVTKVANEDLARNLALTVESLSVAILLEDLTMGTELKKFNSTITYRGKEYTITEENINSFVNQLILFVNRKP